MATSAQFANFMRPSRRLIASTLLTAALAGFTSPVAADDAPAKGKFLVATRDLQDPNFTETVVLLVHHDDEGTMGLVINRPTTIPPSELLPDYVGVDDLSNALYVGGPVAAFGVTMLVMSNETPPESLHVFGNTHVSRSQELLRELLRNEFAAGGLRLYAGHAGWGPGQLDSEITRGSWRVVPANESMVFSDEPKRIWRRLAPAERSIIVQASANQMASQRQPAP